MALGCTGVHLRSGDDGLLLDSFSARLVIGAKLSAQPRSLEHIRGINRDSCECPARLEALESPLPRITAKTLVPPAQLADSYAAAERWPRSSSP